MLSATSNLYPDHEQFVTKFVPKTFARLLKEYSVYGATKIICNPKLEGLPEVLFQYSEIILKDNKIYDIPREFHNIQATKANINFKIRD